MSICETDIVLITKTKQKSKQRIAGGRVGMWMTQNTFAITESDWTLSEGFNSFMNSISYKRQSNLLRYFLSTVTFSVMEGLSRPCIF